LHKDADIGIRLIDKPDDGIIETFQFLNRFTLNSKMEKKPNIETSTVYNQVYALL